MKFSVVTVCFNSATTIADTLRSVATQTHPDVEHIVVDGASRDATMEVVRREGSHVAQFVSEPDNGIYDAMNKGLFLATGDVVAFLNSDDRYADASVLSDVATAFATEGCDYVYGDIQMVNEAGRLVREWKTGTVPAEGLTDSQIPHPALFVRRPLLAGITPPFDPSYRISADLKQQLILVNKLRARGAYLRRSLAVMRMGGASTGGLSNYVAGWRESTRAFNEVHGKGGCWYTIKKVFSKLRGVRLFS
jgi:glycosyltransferase